MFFSFCIYPPLPEGFFVAPNLTMTYRRHSQTRFAVQPKIARPALRGNPGLVHLTRCDAVPAILTFLQAFVGGSLTANSVPVRLLEGRRGINLVCAMPVDPSSLKATPPPDEKKLRDALLRILRERLEARDSSVSVRLANGPSPRERTYTVIINNRPARDASAPVLRRTTGSAERRSVGVWLLNESETRQICERPPNGA